MQQENSFYKVEAVVTSLPKGRHDRCKTVLENMLVIKFWCVERSLLYRGATVRDFRHGLALHLLVLFCFCFAQLSKCTMVHVNQWVGYEHLGQCFRAAFLKAITKTSC